jgi:RNA polymerase sigma factor (sigma-70 family)
MTGNRETIMGGPDRSFPTTIWSDILTAANPASPQSRNKLEQLLLAYWRPVYVYIRVAWHKSIEDAKDLAQAFFTHLLQKEYLGAVRPEKGSFRGYLKAALKHFLIDAERSAAARRPEGHLFSIDASSQELAALGGGESSSPDEAYDREWFRGLVDAGIEDLRRALEQEQKGAYFEVFRIYCIDAPEDEEARPTYREVADRLGIKETDVRNYLSFCRRLLRRLLEQRIRNYVETDRDVDPELFAALGD